MNKTYVLLIAIAFFMSACSTEHWNDEIDIDVANAKVQSKSLSFYEPSVSNPTLHDDWENVTTIYLNDGPEIDAPWVFKAGNSMNIPDDFRADIKKEDGWKLLTHSINKRESGEPNYILFYNKYRGILKVFYYQLESGKNNNAVWIMESLNGPTSVFSSNERLQGAFNSTYEYMSTSNVLRNSEFNFGAFHKGWNACSFELVYGTQNKNPIISIKGYNDENSSLQAFGNFSGNISIEVPKDSKNPFDAIVDKLKPITTFLPGSVSTGLSLTSAVIGELSVFESKNTTTIKGKVAGTSTISGTMLSKLGGLIHSTDHINLREINGNEDLGLWNLSTIPEFHYSYYEWLSPYIPSSSNYYIKFRGHILLYPKKDLTSLVVINPNIASSIKSYKVIDYKYTFSSPETKYQGVKKVSNDCFFYQNLDFSAGYSTDYDSDRGYILEHHLDKNPNVSITVEFLYNDGSKMTVARTYPMKTSVNYNNYIIDQVKNRHGSNIQYIKSSSISYDHDYTYPPGS